MKDFHDICFAVIYADLHHEYLFQAHHLPSLAGAGHITEGADLVATVLVHHLLKAGASGEEIIRGTDCSSA